MNECGSEKIPFRVASKVPQWKQKREKSRLHKEDNRRKILVLCSRNKDPFKDHPGGKRKNVRWIRRKSPKKEEKRCYFSNSDTTL